MLECGNAVWPVWVGVLSARPDLEMCVMDIKISSFCSHSHSMTSV